MEEATSLLKPISTSSLSALLEQGPLPLGQALELLGLVAGQLARLHASSRPLGLLTAKQIRVQRFESGPPVIDFLEAQPTSDASAGADLLALGVLAFQVLVGRPPRSDEALRDARPGASPELDRVVAKLRAPNAADRLSAEGAQRQLLDLAASLSDPGAQAVSPVTAPPHIKRGVPLGLQNTDAHAWVPGNEPTATARPPRLPLGAEATREQVEPQLAPLPVVAPTELLPAERTSEVVQVPPPAPAPAPAPPEPSKPIKPLPPEKTTREDFEPSRLDLPPTGESMGPSRASRPRPPQPAAPPASALSRLANALPSWVWVAAGVVLFVLGLLIIAYSR